MTKNEQTDVIKYVVVIGAAYFLVIKPILQKLGIEKTKDEQQAQEDIIKIDTANPKENPFSGRLFLSSIPKGTKYTALTQKSVKGLAVALRDAFTIFGDNESKAIAIFRQLKTKAQVAQLADAFYKKYTLDMWNFLRNGTPYGGFLTTSFSGLSDKDIGLILNIVNKLPKYK